VHLQDLVFIQDGNPTILENGLINLQKSALLAKIIDQLSTFQQSQYNLTGVEFIQEFLKNSTVLSNDLLYSQSLEREGREANAAVDDLKIRRKKNLRSMSIVA
jgi:hypothetical protein